MISELNLPQPSNIFRNLILSEYYTNYKNNISFEITRKKREIFQNKNVARCVFFDLKNGVEKIGLYEYQKFFNEPIFFSVVAFINTKSELACYPPHTDDTRGVAINFYLNIGGTNVATNYYEEQGSADYFGQHKKYDDVNLQKTYIERDYTKWLAFNTRRFHSIENIETERITLAINFSSKKNNLLILSYDNFLSSYSHLVDKIL